ncbi:alpha/beta fold hydrolase [Blastococcus sp. LR1]|uniref:alpha/beta fold hydrolase n=1 Tax=Blastococcus sp. LR1 TaxID=2877000 RepID=UPI001CCB972F|nr:alpha/beta hydrolase [Blastococcus sp. LR1]MCA0146695.1 alpha/beta hydrolase [Blastococcus sp. LR1]
MPTPVSLVLVPGLGLDERSSRRLRELIPGVVARLPGMGRPEPVPSLHELAAALRAGLPDRPVVLVGHSQSCQVVARAAHDPRVTGVVLCGPTTDPRMRPLRVLAWRWLRTAVAEPWWQVPLVLGQWWHTGPRAMTALWRTAAPERIEEDLAGLPVPVVVVRGSRDALCPADWARQVAAAASRGQLVELPGAAHMTPQTHPEQLARMVGDYWPSVRPRTSA